MTAEIAISRIHFPVTRLGPGRRVGIWVQGCSIRCPGCISVDTWAQGRGRTGVSEVLEAIAPWISIADGFTISGGEPFDQSEALTTLLAGIRKLSAADILVFTGHSLEAIGTQALLNGRSDRCTYRGPFRRDRATNARIARQRQPKASPAYGTGPRTLCRIRSPRGHNATAPST